MGKAIVVSYNAITGIPEGRYAKGNAIAYSADWGRAFTAENVEAGSAGRRIAEAQQAVAEGTLGALVGMIKEDLHQVDTVYVYVGVRAKEGSKHLISRLKALGKAVHMVACKCDRTEKVAFAKMVDVDIIWADECGGHNMCAEIFIQHC